MTLRQQFLRIWPAGSDDRRVIENPAPGFSLHRWPAEKVTCRVPEEMQVGPVWFSLVGAIPSRVHSFRQRELEIFGVSAAYSVWNFRWVLPPPCWFRYDGSSPSFGLQKFGT